MHLYDGIKPAYIGALPDFWESSQQLSLALPCVSLQSHTTGWDGFLLKTDILAHFSLNCQRKWVALGHQAELQQQAYVSSDSLQGQGVPTVGRKGQHRAIAKDGGASHCHPSLFSRALGFICPLECLLMHDHKTSSSHILIASKWVNWFRWSKNYIRIACAFTSLLSMFCQASEIHLGWNHKHSTRTFLQYSSLWLTMETVKQRCFELGAFYLCNAQIYQNCLTEIFDTTLPWRKPEFQIWHLKLIKHIRNKWINWFSHFVV